jgi:galactitol-specific phosphotransferase system IIB component
MPRRGRAQFLVACGTSIATTAMVVEILREDLVRQKKYQIDFHKCKTSELIPKVEYTNPDVVISTAPVNPQTAPFAVAAGASVLVAGTAVFGTNRTVRQAVLSLRQSAEKPPRVF